MAWTGMSPTFASRCGVVESSESASPASSRYWRKPIVTWSVPESDVAPLVAVVTLEGVLR